MGELKHFNPFHDKLGRFSSGRGGSSGSSSSNASKSDQSKLTGKNLEEDLASSGFKKNNYGFMEKEVGGLFSQKAGIMVIDPRPTDKKVRQTAIEDLDKIGKNAASIAKNSKKAVQEMLDSQMDWENIEALRPITGYGKKDVQNELRRTLEDQPPLIVYNPNDRSGEISYMSGPLLGNHELTISIDFSTGEIDRKQGVQFNG